MNIRKLLNLLFLPLFTLGLPSLVTAATDTNTDLTTSLPSIISLVLFLTAYALVISEEVIHLRKSVPVMIAAESIWVLVAIALGYAASIATHLWINADKFTV